MSISSEIRYKIDGKFDGNNGYVLKSISLILRLSCKISLPFLD